MRILKTVFMVVITLFMTISCSAQTSKNEETSKISTAEKVEVFYFHYTRRCATCNAVEKVSKEAIAELYGNKVSFTGYNLDDADGEAKGKELQISGQTLLIVAGDTKIDITNEGFMNARTNPEKLKAIIKEKIDPLI
jgi:predicted membrane-bound dolichyl-phosphate-mannose-protein mannosyltransferase